jgi:hypothetical protein
VEKKLGRGGKRGERRQEGGDDNSRPKFSIHHKISNTLENSFKIE